MSPSHAGPFRKSARSCHWCYFSCSGTMCSTTGVSALPNSKPHLSANCRGICFFASSPVGFVGHLFAGLFSQPQVLGSGRVGSGRLHVFTEPIFTKLHSGACELSQIPLPALKDSKPEKSSLLLWLSPLVLSHSSSALPLLFPSHSIDVFVHLALEPSFLSSLSC